LLLTPSSEFSEDNDDAISDDVKLLNLHFLPVRYVLTDGTPIVIRGLRDQDEIRSFYTAFKDAATSGSGYGIDEFPSFGYFVRWYVSDFYNLVFELAPDGSHDAPSSSHATGGKTVAYANFGRSLLSRSVNNPLLSDGNVVLLPEFRGRRWSSELQRIQFGISYDAGLRRIMGETSTKNIPELLSMRRLGVIVTGSLPRGVYLKDCGWLDLVTLYREINESFLNDMLQPQLSGRLQQLTSKI
jgi:hypothetical protein